MKKIILIVLSASVLLSVTMAHAAQVLFTPTLTLSEEYTDNLFLSPDNEVEDYITRAGLGLKGQLLWRTAGLELDYTPTYNKFADNSDFDYWRHAASLFAWKEIKRNTRFEFRNTYLRSNEPDDKTDALDPENPLLGSAVESDLNRRGRNEYYANVAELRFTQQFGANDSFYLAYNYSILRDVDTTPGQPVDDNDIGTASGGVAYYFSNKWTIELNGYYQDSTYEDDNDRVEYNGDTRLLYNFERTLSGYIGYRHTVLAFDEDVDEDYQIYQPTIGIEKRFKNNARIKIGVGYYIQDFETSDDDSGVIANSEIYKRWDYRLVYFDILGTSGYDIDDSGAEDNGLRIYYEGRLGLGYRFTPHLSSSIFASYRHEEFPNTVSDDVRQTLGLGAGVNWQALRWLACGLDYNYNRVTSDTPAEEYTENSVLLTISIVPVSPYRWN